MRGSDSHPHPHPHHINNLDTKPTQLNTHTPVRRAVNKNGNMWEQPSQELIAQLKACVRLYDCYREAYDHAKASLAEKPAGKQVPTVCRHVCRILDASARLAAAHSDPTPATSVFRLAPSLPCHHLHTHTIAHTSRTV